MKNRKLKTENDLELKCGNDFLPLRPHTIISLFDMIEFFARDFVKQLQYLDEHLKFASLASPKDWKEQTPAVIQTISEIGQFAKVLKAVETIGRCEKFKDSLEITISEFSYLKPHISKEEILSEIEGIQNSIETELSQQKFIFVPFGKHEYFEKNELFGGKVASSFPSAKDEIRAAGNCLAADLNTAAVFHLMRAAEFGMRALAVHLKVKLKGKPIEHGGWNELIEQIEKKIRVRRTRYDKSTKKNKNEFEFLKSCRMMADELYKFKEIWRNNTMHSISSYNEAEAKGVFDRVRDFMQRLSKEVSEK